MSEFVPPERRRGVVPLESRALSALLAAELGRLRRGAGSQDLVLVRDLGHRYRYVRSDQALAFYSGLSPASATARLSRLVQARWICRMRLRSGMAGNGRSVYWLGPLGRFWLENMTDPATERIGARWKIGPTFDPNTDPWLQHWLGITDVGVQAMQAMRRVPKLVVSGIETECEYRYHTGIQAGRWKPDGRMVLHGPKVELSVFFEIDRGTASVAAFGSKIVGAQGMHEAQSRQQNGAWLATAEYWVITANHDRVRQLIQLVTASPFSGRPFGGQSRWRFIAREDWEASVFGAGRWHSPVPRYFPEQDVDRLAGLWHALQRASN